MKPVKGDYITWVVIVIAIICVIGIANAEEPECVLVTTTDTGALIPAASYCTGDQQIGITGATQTDQSWNSLLPRMVMAVRFNMWEDPNGGIPRFGNLWVSPDGVTFEKTPDVTNTSLSNSGSSGYNQIPGDFRKGEAVMCFDEPTDYIEFEPVSSASVGHTHVELLDACPGCH